MVNSLSIIICKKYGKINYIVAYKTDRVNNSQELVARYKKQLDLYAAALSRLFGTGESLIYSFCLKEVIEV